MLPSYVTMPIHVTAKEMIACFTLSVILFCLSLQTFYLVYLYLGVLTTCWHLGLLWAGLLHWCWQFRWPAALVTLLSGWLLLRGSNISRSWQFWWVVAMVSSDGPWFAISMSLALICLSVSGMVFSKATVFPLPWRFWRLVTSICYEGVCVSILSCVDHE